ncbi:MAG: ATP-binding protein [Spirochaetia bacterium]|jgi:signal transduction histidine kinase|nr:ATP-binding protein [Spirochaetia bacterium]
MKVHHVKSIFIKLLAAYVVAFLIISMGVVLVQILSSSSPNTEISVQNLQYLAYTLAAEIGIPPDINVARNIADKTGLEIKISNAIMQWDSDEDLLEQDFLPLSDDGEGLHLFPWEKDFPITIQMGGFDYAFTDFHADYRMSILIWLILAVSILTALSISYMMVRRFLKPLKVMNQTALEFGVSDWNKRVNPKGVDELATLGRAMDGMADRIEKYIHSMYDLLVAVSHELRSPLTRMKVSLEFIENKRIRESMNEEIDTLDRLTGNLLEQRRLTTQPNILNREDISLQDWVLSVCRNYQEKDIPLTYNFEGSDLTVLLDRDRMDLALRNLIENSMRHAPGSSILVSLDTRGNNGFILEVSDTGPGLDENLVSRIGEPFLLGDSSRTGRRTGGGFGLGLSIVKAVAEAHGAAFSVINLEPHGFSVILRFID